MTKGPHMAIGWLAAAAAALAQQGPAPAILREAGVTGGLAVCIGADAKLAAELRAQPAWVVDALPAGGERLPYAENLLNLIVAESPVAREELLRVLAPGGVALTGKEKLVKPWPGGMDGWSHYLYDAGNNAVSRDTLVGPPRRAQWTSGPLWSRNHEKMSSFSVMVSAKGRVFFIADHQSPASMSFPPDWKLTARDAFNGVLLWERAMPEWWPAQFGFKAGPANLTRRLVAVGDRVFVTLGIRAPVSVLDAATGRTIATWEDTRDAEEIVVDGETAFVTGHAPAAYPELKTWPRPEDFSLWRTGPRWLKAINVATGKVLWEHAGPMTPRSLAADAGRVYGHDGAAIVALDREDGRVRWTSDPAPLTKTPVSNFGPTLVVKDEVVLFTGGAETRPKGSAGANTLYAYSAKTGKTLWSAEHPDTGHECPKDLLVVGGKVWLAETAGPKSPAEFFGRDLLTGEVKVQFPPDAKAQWFHHRCHIAKATDNFIITSRKGVEFVDLARQRWTVQHWVRGACLYGILPANGLLYAPPQPCGCMPETKLTGLWALAPAGDPPAAAAAPAGAAERLERGPDLSPPPSALSLSSDWPTYRHDAQRSGSTAAAVPASVKPAWVATPGGTISAVTVAGGRVFVSRVDAREIVALDAATGAPAWRATLGGRATTPPTIANGLALAACADGWVYALRADDGRLAWRFRVAPEERRIVARDQVESAWPVHGSVLVKDGVACAVAGRSMFLDGGMRLVRLDVATGRLLSEETLDDKDPNTGQPLQDFLAGMNLPVSVPDILSADDRHLYMMSQTFSLEGGRPRVKPHGGAGESGPRQPPPADESHLFSAYAGLLDDSWHTRSYWIYGTWMSGGSGGWYQAGQQQVAGRILVFDGERVYGFGRRPDYFGWTTAVEYRLFAAPKNPKVEPFDGSAGGGYGPRQAFATDWAVEIPLHARAMVKAGDVLFVAGTPDVLDEGPKKQYGTVPESPDALDAWEGRKGATLRAVAAADGRTLSEIPLDARPAWDGLAAAGGRLYLSTADGRVVCLRGP